MFFNDTTHRQGEITASVLFLEQHSPLQNFLSSYMDFREAIQLKSHEFLNLCRDYNVRELYVFGSSIQQNSNKKPGDVDLLIELSTEDPVKRGEDLLNLWEKFEIFFQSKVDLLTGASVRNPVLRNAIDSTKVLVYDGKNLKISF